MQNNANLFSHPLEDKTSRKKIEDYSYGLFDKIGKGFSSVVYKGRNDLTGRTLSLAGISQPNSIPYHWLFSGDSGHQGYRHEGGEG